MVRFIFTIIGLMISLDLVWWIVFARLTNHGVARVLVSIFMIVMMLGLIGVIAARMSRSGWERFIPKFAITAIRSEERRVGKEGRRRSQRALWSVEIYD